MIGQQKFNPAIASKRRQKDIMKLQMSDYKVVQSKENSGDFIVEFQGPKETLYQGGSWQVHVLLPDQYPYKSPSIGFNNKIFHPNVDEGSGSVCLDVINQAWSPMFDLVNVFESFLPQLLSYPNPTDPLNPEAASLMLKDKVKYEQKVKDYVLKYATTQQQQQAISLQPTKLTEKQLQKQISQQSQLSSIRKDSVNTAPNSNSDGIENEEEDDDLSNISLDNVSELSDLSELELNEECCY